MRDTLSEILNIEVVLEAYVDSKSVFDVIAKDGVTTEKRLQIDIYALRQSYKNSELSGIGWIPGDDNIADLLTKFSSYAKSTLLKDMFDNKINTKMIGWATMKNCVGGDETFVDRKRKQVNVD